MFFLFGIHKKYKPDLYISRRDSEIIDFLNPTEADTIDNELRPVKEYLIVADRNEDKYEEKWERIRKCNKKIKVQKLDVSCIGETLARYFCMLSENIDDDTCYVILPQLHKDSDRIANKYLLEYLGINKDLDFWLYIINKHTSEIDLSEINKYQSRHLFPSYFCKAESVQDSFSEEKRKDGAEKAKAMGITGDFVCFAGRTSSYNKKTIGDDPDFSYRNMGTEAFSEAIKYLNLNEIQSVRMGKGEEPLYTELDCIDYAGNGTDDFMDLYLSSKCRFFIAPDSGIIMLPMLFSKPVLIINATGIFFGGGGFRYTEYDMFIPKKLYDKHKRRCLTFREMYEILREAPEHGKDFERYNIEHIENTREEIKDAVEEFMMRQNHTWVDTDEDKKMLEKYKVLLNEAEDYHKVYKKGWTGGPLQYMPSISFLRANSYLLD